MQVGQAPYGLLKLNVRGSSSWKPVPQTVQAKLTLSKRSSQPVGVWAESTTDPSPSFRARSMLSASRGRMPSRTTSRSITASMSCALVLASVRSAVTSTTWPSIRARSSPARRIDWRASACPPLRPRTRGARTRTLRPSCMASTPATICSGVWRWISRPHVGQWGKPVLRVEQRR